MEFNPNDLHYSESYKLLIGAVQPRPIAWVSTLSPDGIRNIAPFSFFTAVCSNPPTIVFCPSIRRDTRQPKDTLANIRLTGEFVVNISTEDNAEKMNLTSVEAPPDVDEFDYAGLTALPSKIVKPFRVAESPIHFECQVHQIVDIGDQAGQGSLVIGRVVYFHIEDRIYIPDFKIDTRQLKPIGRLAGNDYAYVHETFEIPRPPSLFKKPSNG
jgi:flavin reductase (DIM6/NTAB) family NADH-FMN oxidoreductase RutF